MIQQLPYTYSKPGVMIKQPFPHRLTELSTWSPMVVLSEEVAEPLRGTALLEEACH